MKKRVFVIGGAALEITGIPKSICRLRDSNPGTVRLAVGGVARNVAAHLEPHAPEEQLVTAHDNDVRAAVIEETVQNAAFTWITRCTSRPRPRRFSAFLTRILTCYPASTIWRSWMA